MPSDNFFHWIGDKIGDGIRAVVDGLTWLFSHLYGAIDSFIQGLTSSLGISASIFSIAILVIGLTLLYTTLRALLRGALVAAGIWTLIAVIILSWLIH